MKKCALKNKISVISVVSNLVTHVVSDLDFEDKVQQFLTVAEKDRHFTIVNTGWFTDSVNAKKPLSVNLYRLKRNKILKLDAAESSKSQTDAKLTSYICQRPHLLNNQNKKFTDALEILAEEAELRDEMSDYGRALAFRKACSALKNLPSISSFDFSEMIKDIGQHSKKIIQDILENGYSEEVKRVEDSEWFRTMKLFTGIYGVGPATAKNWYKAGKRTLQDLCDDIQNLKKDRRLYYGLMFYEDLNYPVTAEEASFVFDLVTDKAKKLHEGFDVTLIGGFRRGKKRGHDIDILITHQNEGSEKGILEILVKLLQEQDLVLHTRIESATFSEVQMFSKHSESSGHMDYFEKCFMIFKVSKDIASHSQAPIANVACISLPTNLNVLDTLRELHNQANSTRDWLARRVDLVVTPKSQYPFALIGWTGNKMFNRSLREYAKKEKNMKLTSHYLFDIENNCSVPASSEEDVFRHLNLPYFQPEKRNA